jgi:hypothetical protein
MTWVEEGASLATRGAFSGLWPFSAKRENVGFLVFFLADLLSLLDVED